MASPRPRKRSSSRTTRRRPSARSRRQRRSLLLVLVAAVALVGLAWCNGTGDWLDDIGPESPAPGQGGSVPEGDVERARELLDQLEVGEWASMSGYSRDRFPHWRSKDRCNARETVLARDGDDVEVDDECRPTEGTWLSPYDGVTLTDPGDIDIDHMVPLANAWRTGANEWDEQRREDFANDLETPQLIAVSATSNRAKGDQDPSQWKPPERAYWCRYAHDWVVVKHHWELSVTSAEKDALADMLDTCG